MAIEKTMLSVSGLKSVNSRIWTIVGLLAATAVLCVPLTGFNVGFSLYTYYSSIPSSVYTENNYYSMDQMISPVQGVLLDIYGNVKAFFANNATLIDEAVVISAGAPVVVNDLGNSTFEISLQSTGITPGVYVRPTTTYTSKGIISSISNNTPIFSGDLEFGTGTVDDALDTVFLTGLNAPNLDNDRTVVYESSEFNTNVSAGLFQVSILPSAVAGQNFSHPVQIQFGSGVRVNNVTTGPAPNTPGGRASLGSNLLVLDDQLPQIYKPDFLGEWNAALNQPTLTNDNCTLHDFNYYLVKTSGNTTLGTTSHWRRKQLAVCQNGTWFHVEDLTPRTVWLFGKQGTLLPELGDYPPPLIPFGSNTLDDAEPGPFIRYDAAPTLPTSQLLTGVAGQILVEDAIVGYAEIPFWNGSASTTFDWLVINPSFNRKGQLVGGQQSEGLVTSLTNNQHITVTGTTNVVLSLDQNIHALADVTFANLTVGTRPIVSSGGGVVRIEGPAGDAVMNTGAQTINSTLTFSGTAVVRSGNGLVLRDNDNADSVRLRAGTTGTSALEFVWPPMDGPNGWFLTTNSDGTLRWSNPPTTVEWVPFTPTIFYPFGTTSVYNAFRRGSGAPGTVMEVMIQMTINASPGTYSRTITILVPVGTIGAYSFSQGHTRGYLAETVLTDEFYGFCQDGLSDLEVICSHDAKPVTSVSVWWVWFTYTVA